MRVMSHKIGSTRRVEHEAGDFSCSAVHIPTPPHLAIHAEIDGRIYRLEFETGEVLRIQGMIERFLREAG